MDTDSHGSKLGARAPEPARAADWTPVAPFPGAGTSRSFVSGEPEGRRLRVAYFARGDGALVARAWFGPGAEGPPGYAHGGAVAGVLDEAMGAAAWLAGHASVAVRLVIDFRGLVPLGVDALVETTVASVDGRKITIRSRLLDDADRVFAEGEALFVALTAEQIADIVSRHGSPRASPD
jgi:acyl-coenzyme A thioesterase PaaI-like protein